jgi:hypothetical protein
MDGISGTLVRLTLFAALVAASSCGVPVDTAASAPRVASTTPARVASPDPPRLPKRDEEQMIVRALTSAGVRGTIVFPSKFEWLFGSAAPRSGTFQGTIDGTQVWADIHFIDGPIDGITACTRLSQTRETAFTVSVRGRPQVLGNGDATGYLGSAGPMYFAANDRLFVMTPDVSVRDALRSSLALSIPTCIWREPATLPALSWEPEVMDALQRGGVETQLVGGSKFETFLGDRRDARVFITASLVTYPMGAEVLYLTSPLREIRMCSAPSSPGFTKWTVRVDGKDLPGMEGSQTAYPLVGPRFFVLAWDATSAQALAKGLGLSAPTC